ncbi:MAG: hypothetical protein Q8P62_02055 [Candidatus Peregrinibacteria bacterium]|nr:hypothetical protein [Candidatus Peregrinibacteria bacterium]
MPNVNTPDGVDLEEGMEKVEGPAVAETTDEASDNSDLLKDFSMERLFDGSKKASYSVQSEDFEMGVPDRHDWERRSVKHIPESLRGLPETKKIFDFIRTPSTDRAQIKQRQALITSLREFDGFDEAIKLKNDCYAVYSGISEHLFATIRVSDYLEEAALFAYRNGNQNISSRLVEEGLDLVQKGRKSIFSLASLLSKSGNPLLLVIAKELEALGKSLECLTRDFFLKEDYFKVSSVAQGLSEDSRTFNEKIGVFFEFANISKNEGYTPAGLDICLPRTYKKGWNFVRKKESPNFKQVLNDSPDEHEVTVYSGSNMSGKSFSGLKKEFFMQCLAQSFGYVPCEAGSNFPVMHDSFHYLDRASTDHFRDLSAFGSETDNWKKLTSSLGNKSFVCVDEGWSTTSAQDQYKLLRAGAVLYLPSKGARVFLASHNEKFLQKHISQPNLGMYHFETEIDEVSGTPIYRYELARGLGDSNALAVAKGLKLDSNIIENAQKYLDGQDVHIGETAKPNFRDVVPYTEEERQKLKNPEHRGKIPYVKRESILTVFSSDKDFRFGLTLPMDDSNIKFGGWSPHNVELRKQSINNMVVGGVALTSQEVFERQRTFQLLAENDRFEEMLDLEQKLLFMIKFLPLAGYENFLKFNLAISPFEACRGDINDLDLVLAYLDMNMKLMGDSFPMKKQVEDLRKLKSRLDTADAVVGNRSVEEIFELLEKEQNEVITDAEALNLFKKLSKNDEPNRKALGGVITRKRITDYLRFIHDKHWKKTLRNIEYRELGSMVGDDYFAEDLSVQKKLIDEKTSQFFEIAAKFEDGFSDQDKGKVTVKRIRNLWKKIKALYESVEEESGGRGMLYSHVCALADFASTLESLQNSCGLSEEEMGEKFNERMTPRGVRSDIHEAISSTKKDAKTLPALKLWDCDLSKVKDEIRVIVDYWKEHRKDSDISYHNSWGGELPFVLLMEMFVDGRDYPAEFTEALRSYDSIETDKMAYNLEQGFRDYATPHQHRYDRTKKSKMATVAELISKAKAVYEGEVSSFADEVSGLEARKDALFAKYPEIAKFIDEYFDGIKKLSSFVSHYSGHENFYGEKCRDIICTFYDVKFGRHFDVPDCRKYLDSINNAKSHTAYGDIMRSFFENEIKGSNIIKEISSFLSELEVITKEAMVVAKKHKVFGSSDYGDSQDHYKGLIKSGNFYPLQKAIDFKFRELFGKEVYFSYMPDDQKPLNSSIAYAMGLFYIGHMIKKQGMQPVSFNTTGEIHLPKAWSLFAQKDKQVKNDVSFGPKAPSKILGSSNMSGKTFWEKGAMSALLWAQATGYAPCAKGATMPLLDNIMYFDRVTSRSDQSLSSYGEEITRVNKMMEKTVAGKVNLVMLDEFGSSTSPKYQDALYYAMVVEMLRRGQYAAFASHCHDATDALSKSFPNLIEVAHFGHTTERDGNGEIKVAFDHKMSPKREDSEAIDVAEMLKLNPEIIKFARLI